MHSLFFKYHEICFEYVLVQCYVHNEYVTLVSLIYMYINRQDSLVIMKGYVQFREALSKEAGF